jgi:hypothetical protein
LREAIVLRTRISQRASAIFGCAAKGRAVPMPM